MRAYILLLILLFSSCLRNEEKKYSQSYDLVELTFYGSSDIYDTSERIRLSVVDSLTVKKFNELKNSSKFSLNTGIQGTDYILNVLFIDSETKNELLVRIIKNIDLKPVVFYRLGGIFDVTHENTDFVDYASLVIRLDSIVKYEGELTQELYDKVILGIND